MPWSEAEYIVTHMPRFQALTNSVLQVELEQLAEDLGLTKSQKADLLKELVSIARWVVSQVRAGRAIEARSGDRVERLEHPALDRLRTRGMLAGERIVLYGDDVARLSRMMSQPFTPTPGLRKSLAALSDPARKPPGLRWHKATAKRRKKTRSWPSESSR